MRPQILIDELNTIRSQQPNYIQDMNRICQEGFQKAYNMIETMENPIVVYVIIQNK